MLMGYLVYFNVFKAKDIINSPYNPRQDTFAQRVVRGKILDGEKNVLAETVVDEEGNETRNYPMGDLYGHVVGYASKGKAGLESIENFNLLTSNAFFLERILKEFKNEKNMGDNVVTTLNTTLQQAAYSALGKSNGAVVVMDASTGKIMAMVSKPTYNPGTIDEDWEVLNANENGIFINRATQGAYAPGSTFKLVSTLEFMRQNPDYQNYQYECQGEITQDGTTIHCFNGTVHGSETLADSLANSCNASYANIGLGLDKKKYRATAEELLFNKKLPSVLPYRQSKFQITSKATSADMMMTSMGQGETQVSPYHMAIIVQAIANGGTAMKPYLVDRIENHSGTTVTKNMPEKYGDLMTSDEAAKLKEYMKGVVDYGTATILQNGSYSVAGKTGTAEYSSDKEKEHSWFVGFTDIDNPELVISVVVEGADESGIKATSVAKKVLDAYY